jgi:hypothetical protein
VFEGEIKRGSSFSPTPCPERRGVPFRKGDKCGTSGVVKQPAKNHFTDIIVLQTEMRCDTRLILI